MKRISESDIKWEIDQLIKRFRELKEEHGDQFEFSLQTAIYDSQEKLILYRECLSILNPNNHDFYIKRLELSKKKTKELWRFLDFLRLGEFLVICKDGVHPDDLLFDDDGLLVEGRIYVVTSYSFFEGDLYFQLRHRDGPRLNIPVGFVGFDSSRFDLVDYTKLN